MTELLATTAIAIHRLSPTGVGEKIGSVVMMDTPRGLLVQPNVCYLPPGFHGFHIHQFPLLSPKNGKAGGGAGQHYDPLRSGHHLGPYRRGHLGDMPRLWVGENGCATTPVVAPHLTTTAIINRAVIIHLYGDNYSDYPIKDGGGRVRIAGGIITDSCPYCH